MASPQTENRKLGGYEFYEKILKSPKLVVAPMVDQSEYAWRILSRRYKADLCYTPMFHARMFGEPDRKYKNENWQTGPGDRPLVAQFCANDPQHLLAAAKLIEHECDAVDINLGCPQHIAKRGHYGSFLMEEWDLIAEMVRTLHRELSIPVTCKIRIFPDVEKTLQYAKMIEAAGCQLLTVHGRFREQKGHKTGLADWEQIRRVKEAVKIPVFANGNILYYEDIQRCIEYTKVDGVMTAEGNLYNPALFSGKHLPSWKLAQEYLEICRDVPKSATISMIRAHLFKLFHACLSEYTDMRTALVKANTIEGFFEIVQILKSRLVVDANGADYVPEPYEHDDHQLRKLPRWALQPYVRPELPKPGELGRREKERLEQEAAEHDETAAQPTASDQVEEKVDQMSPLKRAAEDEAAPMEESKDADCPAIEPTQEPLPAKQSPRPPKGKGMRDADNAQIVGLLRLRYPVWVADTFCSCIEVETAGVLTVIRISSQETETHDALWRVSQRPIDPMHLRAV
ncbi:uncharacterized protein BJ171DRAFT_426333 [Polychytrium aggregatum]|uniref:uncharacterized protein n=1 Tax=Polychytrium aggregatum TaxID=110093 RepID=UPI0022FECAC7|nr:uncharacterized protein BJ171DRAFT_426333 [Polychytrium aggregatum]KAI9202566.1 hypothetical protein BJ171DRAFT_426333 [Polychytrium aggregatum]